MSRRLLIAVLLLLFVGILAGTAWMMTRGKADAPLAVGSEGDAAAIALPQAMPTGTASPSAATQDALEGRVLDLEQRVLRVSAAAQTASSYANRAEAIMVAFATRRALDAGAPLGYLEGQLRVLFEAGQPRAVATIINAARDPVTVNKLRAGLEDISVIVTQGAPNEGWWAATRRMFGGLIEVRRAGEPSPAPDARLARTRRAVEAGQIEQAIKEMAAMPAQPVIAQWLEQARRYNEARRALDVIEAAAMLEARTAPIVAPTPVATPTPEATPSPAPGPATP